jgi:uncharacterized protein YdeI (YjbR/CyaY-like superfamily)
VEPVIFFATPAELRARFAEHHGDAAALRIGFYERGTGRRSVTWAEAVDQALWSGWIDGVRRGVDVSWFTFAVVEAKRRAASN